MVSQQAGAEFQRLLGAGVDEHLVCIELHTAEHAQAVEHSPTSNRLADELVVFAMRPDPKPMYAAGYGDAKCAIEEADPDAMKSTICNRLEMQRWMIGIGLELGKVSVRYGLNFSGQSVKALPEPL